MSVPAPVPVPVPASAVAVGRAVPALLVLDNYDSFTFNLVHLVRRVAPDLRIDVVRADQRSARALLEAGPDAVLLSPGPGLPRDAGVCLELVRTAPPELPIFGVCLGMQIIAEAFGGDVVRAPRTMHGRTSRIRHADVGAFAGLPQDLTVMRYHSWLVDEATLPAELEPTAWADDGTLMGLRHRTRPLEAVQFHPESFMTEHGHSLIAALVRSARTVG